MRTLSNFFTKFYFASLFFHKKELNENVANIRRLTKRVFKKPFKIRILFVVKSQIGTQKKNAVVIHTFYCNWYVDVTVCLWYVYVCFVCGTL